MSLFGISSIIIFFSALGFGLLIYDADRFSKINIRWFILSVCIAVWGLALGEVVSAGDAHTAFIAQYFLDAAAIFIPVAYFGFASELAHLRNYKWRYLSYVIALGLVAFSLTSYFKVGMIQRFGFYWIDPGPYYNVFPLFFAIFSVIATWILVRAYMKSSDRLYKHQIFNTLLAGIIGISGGFTNFFPQVINIYPFGNYFVILYIFFVSYGVLRYKLLSAKVITTQIFAGAIVLVFLFNLLQVESFQDWLIRFLLFVLVLFFSIFLVRGVYREVYQREKIQILADGLEQANKEQESLLHFVTHEIKGYLTDSRNTFSLMLQGDIGPLNEDQKTITQEAYKKISDGVDTVMMILQASNLKGGALKMDKQTFDFVSAVKEVSETLANDAKAKNLDYDVAIDKDMATLSIDGDRELINRHVVRNLIDNAIKYTQKGTVSIFLTKKPPTSTMPHGSALFAVKDSGVGITDEDKKRLFTEGGRGKDSVKMNVHSTGYGLFFAKGIVDAHQGKIWAESAGPGQGSTFFVELPLAA
jgi:signal transduction histidine kinase